MMLTGADELEERYNGRQCEDITAAGAAVLSAVGAGRVYGDRDREDTW